MLALLLLLVQPSHAEDVNALFAQAFEEQPTGPLYQAGSTVELWATVRLTMPDGTLGAISHESFVIENQKQTVNIRVERIDRPAAEAKPLGAERVEMTFQELDLAEVMGFEKPEDKERQQPAAYARIEHGPVIFRVIGMSEDAFGDAKKLVKAIGEQLRTPISVPDATQADALSGKRLTPKVAPEHGYILDLCPQGIAKYAYEGAKPIGGAVPVAESAQEAAGTWVALPSEIRLTWTDGTALVLPREGDDAVGFAQSAAACD